MKTTTRFLLALAAIFTGLATASLAAEPAPGYVDFGHFSVSEKGQFVEVKLNGFTLNFVAKLAKHDDPAAAELIANLKSVRVNVVGLDDANRDATTDRVAAVGKQLEGTGWEQVVTVRGNHEDDVAIYVKHRDEMIAGLVVTVIDGRKNEAVFVNVVGDIKPEQLATLGKHLHLDHLNLGTKTI